MFPSYCDATQQTLKKTSGHSQTWRLWLTGGFGVFIHLVPLTAICAENLSPDQSGCTVNKTPIVPISLAVWLNGQPAETGLIVENIHCTKLANVLQWCMWFFFNCINCSDFALRYTAVMLSHTKYSIDEMCGTTKQDEAIQQKLLWI